MLQLIKLFHFEWSQDRVPKINRVPKIEFQITPPFFQEFWLVSKDCCRNPITSKHWFEILASSTANHETHWDIPGGNTHQTQISLYYSYSKVHSIWFEPGWAPKFLPFSRIQFEETLYGEGGQLVIASTHLHKVAMRNSAQGLHTRIESFAVFSDISQHVKTQLQQIEYQMYHFVPLSWIKRP